MTRPERVSKMLESRNSRSGVRIKNLRAKRRRFYMTRRQIILIISAVFVFMGSGISYVWSCFERTQLGYNVSQLKKEEMDYIETNRKLRLELALLKSPQRLEALATKRLGMRRPSPGQVILLP